MSITDNLPRRVAKVGAVITALAFAFAMWVLDWTRFRGAPFYDLQNYIEGFYYGRYQYSQTASLIEWYTQEYLWRGLVYQLGYIFSFEGIFSAIAFVTLTVSCIFVALRSKSWVYLVLLISPLTVDLAFSQARSAFGMAIIWLAMLMGRTPIRIALLVLTPMIHSAMLVYSVVLLIPWEWNVVRRHAPILAAAVIVGAAIFLGPLRNSVLESIGDRRAYNDIVSSGILFTAMLAAYGLPFAFAPSLIVKDRTVLIAVMSALISLSVNLSGGSGNRFVALALPAFIAGYSRIPSRLVRRCACLGLITSSGIYFVFFWAG